MELVPGVHSLGQWRGGRVHAFLLATGNELTLIDTLFDHDARRVLAAIRKLGYSPSDLRHIVVTHGHRSHLGGLATLKRLSGATIYAHPWEADIIAGERRAQPVTLRPTRPLRTWWRVYHLQLGLQLGLNPHRPCPVDRPLADGDAVGPLQVIDAPGHSPGHMAFYWPEKRVLFAGDAVATWPALAPGWPAFNLNLTRHRVTLRRMAGLEPEVVAVGHGEPLSVDAAEHLHHLAHML